MPGDSWQNAKRTISAALAPATNGNDIVYVATGTYNESLLILVSVTVYGGFKDDASGYWDPTQYPTTVTSGGSGRVVTVAGPWPGPVVLNGLQITGGVAGVGAGIYAASARITIENCVVSSNHGRSVNTCSHQDYDGMGGGIFLDDCIATIENCHITSCKCGSYGGGIACFDSTLSVANSVVSANRCILYGCASCDDCVPFGEGGGIYASGSSITLTNNEIEGNLSGYLGGGFCGSLSDYVLHNNRFSQNSGLGGAMYLDQCIGSIDSNQLQDNEGNSAIGASGGDITISDNLVIKNHAYRGTCMQLYDMQVAILNNTFSSNLNMGAADCLRCTGQFANNICHQMSYALWEDSGVAANNNCFWNLIGAAYRGGASGQNDVLDDPLFTNSVGGDFSLATNSPCVDRGDDSVLSKIELDINGNARKMGAAVDIGAYESSFMRISGTFDFEYYVGPAKQSVDLGFTTPGSTVPFATETVTLNDSLGYTLTAPLDWGLFDIVASPIPWLRQRHAIDPRMPPSSVDFNLINGDPNTDNVVDLKDLNQIFSDFGLAGQHASDLDGSGIVDLRDLNIIFGNFGLKGDQ